MTRRIRIINEFARSLDAREGNRQITVGSLRTGDVLSSTGEKVIAINRNYTLVGLMLSKGGYGRPVTWDAKAKISVVGRDGVGTPEEVAYGEGWHSTENVNPYTSATEKAAWEKGRAAKKLKFKSNTNARRGEVRGRSFQPPKQKIADFRSEKGYVAKIIDVKTGGVLKKSEPHISNGVGLKNWIQTEALKLIRQGKRVKAEVGVEFFDPDRMDDSQDTEKVNIVYRKNWRIMSYEPSPGVVRFAVYEGSDMKGKENNIQTLGAAKRYVDYLAKGGY